jgi:pimeloyl-ACP methyl ester carboxylesterase
MNTAHLKAYSLSSLINSTFVRLNDLSKWAKTVKRASVRAGVGVASVVAPRFVLKKASDLFLTPPRFAHSQPEQRLLDGGAQFNVDTSAGKISAWRFGDASNPAIIMSHGWGGRGAQFRAFVPKLVEAGYQPIIFDHIGHGMSEGRQAALVDFWRGVDAVWDHMSAEGVAVAGLIGHSLGSAGIASALRRPLSGVAHIGKPRAVLIAPPASLIGYSRLFSRYLGIPERIRAAMQWRFEKRYGVDWQEFELPDSVTNIKAAALFIHDRDDKETRFDGGVALARAWPDARLHATQGLGHRRILRNASVVQATIDFITDSVRFSPPPESESGHVYDEPARLY